jgi:hypothetical protein
VFSNAGRNVPSAEQRISPNCASVRSEADAKLKRLYDAIENGIADLSDPMLKDRVAELKAVRDQTRVDAERAQDAIERVAASQNIRQPGPQAHADRERRLSSRSPPRACSTR